MAGNISFFIKDLQIFHSTYGFHPKLVNIIFVIHVPCQSRPSNRNRANNTTTIIPLATCF